MILKNVESDNETIHTILLQYCWETYPVPRGSLSWSKRYFSKRLTFPRFFISLVYFAPTRSPRSPKRFLDLQTSYAVPSDIFREQSPVQIKPIIKFDLNKKGKEHIYILITKYPNFFHLSNDEFICTNATNHKIMTTDERLIYIKQYRFPSIHKDEINKQVQDLLINS
jgi:hypothetical protein